MVRPDTFAQLIAAGMSCIHARGFAATGVQEITEAAGVPKGSFYNHFPSKAAFGLAVLEAYWEASLPAIAMLEENGVPAPARLARHFRAVQEWLQGSGQECGCLLGNFAVEAPSAGPEIRARVAQMIERWTKAMAACLREGAAEGSIRRDIAPEDLAHWLLTAFQGSILRAKVETTPASFDAFHRSMRQIIRE